MKKLSLATITVFTVIFLLASCGGGDSKNDDNNQNQSSAVCSYGEYECHGDDSYFCGYSGDDLMWIHSETCDNGCNTSTGKCNSGSNGNNDNPNEDNGGDTEWDPEEDYNDDEGGNNGGGSIFEPCEEDGLICRLSSEGENSSYICKKTEYPVIVWEKCSNDCDSSTGKCKPWKDPDSKLAWSSKYTEKILWNEAVSYCENLDEDGHSDWRLPNISELRTLIKDCPASITGGTCPVTESCTSFVSCFSEECGCYTEPDYNAANRYSKIDNLNGPSGIFWSSSLVPDLEDYHRWCINFSTALINSCDARVESNVRCVRNAD